MSAATEIAAGRLAEAVREELRDGSGTARVAVPLGDAQPLGWLAGASRGSRFYWRARSGGVVAGAGVAAIVDADDVPALARLTEALPRGAGALVTGRFDPSAASADAWRPFGRVRAVLPRLEMRVDEEIRELACYVTDADRAAGATSDADPVGSGIEYPTGDGMPGPAAPRAIQRGDGRRDTPGVDGWGRAVAEAREAFEAGSLQKVVLARRSEWELERAIDALAALRRLGDSAPSCYHVLVEAGDAAFLSATPERLFRIAGGRVDSEAVAGTQPVPAQGAAFGDKDLREHAHVVSDIRERLEALVGEVDIEHGPSLLALAHRTHLRTRIGGSLRAGVRPLDVLAALHPTPAVGGQPREAALDFITRTEGFDRGLYAGFVGRIGRDAAGGDEAEVAVGIRSALLEPRRATLYAGAGIVAGSDSAAEWDEVEGKMGDLASVLGLA